MGTVKIAPAQHRKARNAWEGHEQMSRSARYWLTYGLVVGTIVVFTLVWLSNTQIAQDDPTLAGFIGIVIMALAGYAGIKMRDRMR